ncbi:transcriptional regulator (plasmid) [Bacillus cereus]|uniref:helix-turn-helix transcriptional regulator n=1 Tax=Bacillus cereus TaxID=1396 RepID=UPI000C2D0A8B|nr:helix-turn-helix transcriptional regulator [Bacillus cereus]AUB67082.1 transcriptional regulator [Bacillus cereus]
MSWFGIGKPRSKFGKFIDKHNLTQHEIAKKSGVSEGTISRLCRGDAFLPSLKTGSKIINTVKQLTNKNVDYTDFWL